ncbi:MAG: bifunctional precorrin-2 dehydrogenase/sirohydrochlorin ferrochelatase [Bacteroidetes bacterium]|nr:MAG: bifunctional precorrin-2 dehydrogenase/sirohydrochlorin ferrochelatase [Bacteroidota bacterium]
MNTLFPVFLKLENLHTLLVGGGNVGLEKLSAMLANSPNARITVVADRFLPETLELAQNSPLVEIVERRFDFSDLQNKDLILCATDNKELHAQIKEEARKLRILVNVADTPPLCDFYLGSIVQKGDLKIAISTNGKSPTLAKRIRAYLEENLPAEIQNLLDNLQHFRDKLKGDFQFKIKKMNEITSSMLDKNS